MPTANEELLSRQVRHAVYTQRYGSSVVRRILALLSRADADLQQRLLAGLPEGIESRQRLNEVLRDIRILRRDLYLELEQDLVSELEDLVEYEGGFQLGLIEEVTPLPVNLTAPALSTLRAAVMSRPFQGRFLREWASGLRANDLRRIRDQINIGIVTGEGVPDIVRRIIGTKSANYRDGILNVSRNEAETIVRTAVNHTVNSARNEIAKANDDIVKGVEWVSTLDGRTSAICRGRDGNVYPVDSGPRPPAHFNCRSTISYVLRSWRELGIDRDELSPGTRASMNGQVPADLTYGEWLRRQDRDFVFETLGPSRARLFLDGDLKIERFVLDRTGREFTLDELRRRQPAAWSRAFDE